MSYIPLDAVFKRKKLEEKQEKFKSFPDKRRFRARMGAEESLEKSIISEMSSYGISSDNIPRILREFKSVKEYQTLNVTLFLEAYFYYNDKNFDFYLVMENFDHDFEEIIKNIYHRGLFGGKKFTPVEKYKFRQDFIIYMILIIFKNPEETDFDSAQTIDIGEEIADFNEVYVEPIGE